MLIHHRLPKQLHIVRHPHISRVFALAVVGRRHHQRHIHLANLFHLVVVAHSSTFGATHQLPLQTSTLKVFPIMLRYIPCNGTNVLLGIGNMRALRKLLLQIGFLILAQPLRHLLKIPINHPLVHILVGIAPFVHQRQHRLVFHSLPHCILIYHIAKLVQRVSILYKQRRTRKGNKTSIGHRFLHIYVECAMLCAVPLVNQHKYIVASERLLYARHSRFKLINDGSNHRIGIGLQYLHQVAPTSSIYYLHPHIVEGARNLFIQIGTVCYQQYQRIVYSFVLCNSLCHERHGKRFSTSLRVPYHPTRTRIGVQPRYLLHSIFYSKILLIAGYLFHPLVIQNKIVGQIQQSLWRCHSTQ